MPITRASFGLVTQLLDLTPASEGALEAPPAPSPATWEPVQEQLAALGVGAVAEEVALGTEATIGQFLELQAAAQGHGVETFLRLRELSEEGLATLREQALEAAARRAPGEAGPINLRLMVDLGQPDPEQLARWLPRGGGPIRPELPGGGEEASTDEGPGGWGQALAFSLFAPEAESALRRLDGIGETLIEAARRPGVELPVWLAAFGVGDEGAAGSAAGVIQVGIHALALGIERIFLAAGPETGWWPADLRSPPPPLQAFRTLTGKLHGATGVRRFAAGQYLIERGGEPPVYLLWADGAKPSLPGGIEGLVEVTDCLGESRRVEAERVQVGEEPVFVMPLA